MEITEVVLTATAAETAEGMTADAAMKEMIVAAAIIQITDAVMTAQIMETVIAGLISVRNLVLSKDPLCSIKIRDVDARNLKIIAVIVSWKKKYEFLRMCGGSRTF